MQFVLGKSNLEHVQVALRAICNQSAKLLRFAYLRKRVLVYDDWP